MNTVTKMQVGFLVFLAITMCQFSQINGQLTLTPFQHPFNIREDTILETPMAPVDCTNPGDQCLCNIKNAGGAPFQVWKKGTSNDFMFYYVGAAKGGPLSFQKQPTYFLDIECKNTTGGDVQQVTIEIDVQQNKPPTFTKNIDTTDVYVTSTAPALGDDIYKVDATDIEGDPLTFSFKDVQPPVNYFTIGQRDGQIKLNVDPHTITEDKVFVTVEVSDGSSSVDNFNLEINLHDLNHRPQILNLPTTITIPEDTASPYNIMTLDIDDPDTFVNQLLTSFTVKPPSEAFKFDYDPGTRRLKLVSSLDYESINQYEFTFTADDGFLQSENDVLTLKVSNVNEPPEFDEIAYRCVLDESKAGISQCDINAVITDPEGDPIPTVNFLNGNNSNRFHYDMSSSTISFTVDYDVDQTNMPSNVILQLEATDVLGASSKVPVYINVNDVNDNVCDFGPNTLHTFQADQGTQLGTIGTFIATDDDLTSPNNKVTYEVIRALPPESSNYISAYNDGSLAYTGLIPETNHGKSYSLVVRCKDGGIPQLTSEATIVLTYMTTTSSSTTTTTTPTTTTTTPTTTTTEEYDIWEDEAFVGVFATLMSLVSLGALASIIGLCRLCGLWGALCKGCGPMACPGPSEGTGASEFCCPRKPKKVKPDPDDDYFNTEIRTNNEYRDAYWKTTDNYESGMNYNAQGDAYAKPIEGGPKRLALPAPHPKVDIF